jgi:PKD repeat protein
MKKLCQLISLGLVPSLMIILVNLVLAGYSQASPAPGTGRTPGSTLIQTQLISDVVLIHSTPTSTTLPIVFTATVAGGAAPIFYTWSFGDGNTLPLTRDNFRVVHAYNATGTYTVVVTVVDNALSTFSQTISVTIEEAQRVYLPQLLQGSSPPLDLACESLSLDPPIPVAGQTVIITAKIKNQGEGAADGFWVDLYINPTTVPTTGHLLPWQNACGGPSSCPTGIAWSVSNTALAVGLSRSLLSVPAPFHPDGFSPAASQWSGSLHAGNYNLYAYVDSIDNPVLANTDGAVKEVNEFNNRCDLLGLTIAGTLEPAELRSNSLPARPVQ